MSIAPGDILSRAVVEGQDIQGRWWVNAGRLRGNIPGKYAKTCLTSGQVLDEVVYLGNGEFALERYEERLIKQFYYLGYQVSQEAARVETWVSRWQEVAARPASVTWLPLQRLPLLPAPPPDRGWQLGRGRAWLMPVSECLFLQELGGELRFCPSNLKGGYLIRRPLPAAYRVGVFYGNTCPPPLSYPRPFADGGSIHARPNLPSRDFGRDGLGL